MRFILSILLAIVLVPTAASAQREGSNGARPTSNEPVSATLASEQLILLPDQIPVEEPAPAVRLFRSAADSLDWDRARSRAERARGYRLVVELFERRLHVVEGNDTLLVAPIAVGMSDSVLTFEGQRWRFDTPRGRRTVLRKEADPVWVPPDWHYVEVAADLGLEIARLDARHPVRLEDGRRLVVRGGLVGILEEGEFSPLPTDEQIIFDGKLYIPPFGTENRRIPHELGRFRLDLGQGYLLHGTPHEDTIGDAATHGCIRLFDADIEWLFENVPVGSAVFIY